MEKIVVILIDRFRSDSLIIAIFLAVIKSRSQKIWERIKVDTIAFIIFGVVTSIVTIIYEVLIAQVEINQWWQVRILYNVIRLLGVYFLGKMTDQLRVKINNKLFRQFIYQALFFSVHYLFRKISDFFEIITISLFYSTKNRLVLFLSLKLAVISNKFYLLSQFVISDKIIIFIVKGISDGISLSLYQIPAYVFSALILGIDYHVVLFLSLIYLFDNMIFGWFFGYILDKTRLYFSKRKFAKG